MISRELFVECIENIITQYYDDMSNADLIKQVFQVSEFAIYDNSKLVNSIIRLLQEYFPKDANGHCEITHYCFVMNFGKVGEEFESADELYDRLISEKKPLPNDKPDGRRYKIGEDKSFH